MWLISQAAPVWRNLGFFAMALAAHLALLMLPLERWNERPRSQQALIRVQLQSIPAPNQDEPIPKRAEASLPDEESVTRPQARPAVTIKPQLSPEALTDQASPEMAESQPEVLPESKQLRKSISSLHESDYLTQPEKPKHALGAPPKYQMPRNWEKHAGAEYLASYDNTFNGMTAPEKVEIVDRWLAADGSHRVVVNLPNGETMCGRAEPYNPMQPLVEHIMLFVPCGSGGKRSFGMPERYHLNR